MGANSRLGAYSNKYGIYTFLTPHIFSLRGAELVDEHVRAQLEAVRREDKGKMDRIKKS